MPSVCAVSHVGPGCYLMLIDGRCNIVDVDDIE